MSRLEGYVRKNLTPILLLLLAGGYLVILGELVLYSHWQGTQLIGFGATVVGLLCVLVGLFARGGLRVALAGILLVLSLAGLLGTREHLEEGGEAAIPTQLQAADAGYIAVAFQPGTDVRQENEEENEEGERREGGEAVPPPLAPLSLSGLSLMGAAILVAKQDRQN